MIPLTITEIARLLTAGTTNSGHPATPGTGSARDAAIRPEHADHPFRHSQAAHLTIRRNTHIGGSARLSGTLQSSA
jgi:hypothetical protein